MPIDPRKRQEKQARHAAKRKAKQRQLAREKHAGLAERLRSAARYPVLHCLATTDLWTQGIGWVCLSRELPNRSVGFGVFLVDRYCLGVKNALADITGRSTYESQVARKMHSDFSAKDLHPEAARTIVEGAVEYARSLGLHPHPDYDKAKLIFGETNAGAGTEEIEFGRDGKPFFIAGPHDTPERCRQILKALEQSCGAGGFDYLIPLADASTVLPESLKRKEVRAIGPDETGAIRDYEIPFSED